jgi:hypothetical protein
MTDLLAPIHKTIEVDLPITEAFRLFTEEIGRWWPLASHSIGEAEATGCWIDGGPGGGMFESARDGTRHRWGTIMTWDPPRRMALTWHPGRDPKEHTMLEIDFFARSERRTRIELIHSGWQAGDQDRHRRYERGWDEVLHGGFASFAARAG